MPPPDPRSIEVATDALRRDADIWAEQAASFSAVSAEADQLRLNRVQAGQFQLVLDGYAQVVDQVVARTREAAEAMTAVSATLRASADTYDGEEAAQVHRLRNLY